MKEVNAVPEADRKLSLVRSEALPLRLELARSYENLIAAFVTCAKSPGEIGTISSIESGSRERMVSAHDKALAQILGTPLPSEAAVSTSYQGTPRILVPAKRTQMTAGEREEIRAFVLSGPKCTGVNLHWRPLGEGRFKKLVASHRARQAYRVALPASSRGTVEYYLEAALADGQKLSVAGHGCPGQSITLGDRPARGCRRPLRSVLSGRAASLTSPVHRAQACQGSQGTLAQSVKIIADSG